MYHYCKFDLLDGVFYYNYMTSSMSLTDKESFDNFLDYKDDIECELSLKLNTDNMEYFDLAVLKELHTRNLVNYKFYKKQREMIKVVHQYRRDHTQISWTEYFLYGIVLLNIILTFVLLVSKRDLLNIFLWINKEHIDKSLDKMKVKPGL